MYFCKITELESLAGSVLNGNGEVSGVDRPDGCCVEDVTECGEPASRATLTGLC